MTTEKEKEKKVESPLLEGLKGDPIAEEADPALGKLREATGLPPEMKKRPPPPPPSPSSEDPTRVAAREAIADDEKKKKKKKQAEQ